MAVKVAIQGSKTQEIEFRSGMDVADVLKKIKTKLPKTSTITVNGEETTKKSKVKDKDTVVVTPKVRNG